jgi:hypothetical protein
LGTPFPAGILAFSLGLRLMGFPSSDLFGGPFGCVSMWKTTARFSGGFDWAETHISLGQETIPVGRAGEQRWVRTPLSSPSCLRPAAPTLVILIWYTAPHLHGLDLASFSFSFFPTEIPSWVWANGCVFLPVIHAVLGVRVVLVVEPCGPPRYDLARNRLETFQFLPDSPCVLVVLYILRNHMEVVEYVT